MAVTSRKATSLSKFVIEILAFENLVRSAVQRSAKHCNFGWHLQFNSYKSNIFIAVKNPKIPVQNKHLWALSEQSR